MDPIIRWKTGKGWESKDHILLVVMHHIVTDGWSMGVFNRELKELYKSYSEGKESNLQELNVQYVDYAGWQRSWLKDDLYEEQVGYWKEKLKGIKPLELPTDKVRPARQSYRGATKYFEISSEMFDGIEEVVPGMRGRRYTWCCWRHSMCCYTGTAGRMILQLGRR